MKKYLSILLLIFSTILGCKSTDGKSNTPNEIAAITAQSKAFSLAYMDEDIEKLVDFYWEDGMVLSTGQEIVSGTDSLLSFWEVPDSADILFHQARPERIEIMGDLVSQTPHAVDATELYAEQIDVPIHDNVALYAGYENGEVFFMVYRKVKAIHHK